MHRFDCQIKSHGQFQLECHARYPLDDSRKLSEYLLDMFIYTPSQLDITSQNYGVDKFLSDLQCYTRYTHPFIPLAKLIDDNCEISPLTRIKKQLTNVTLDTDVRDKKIMYELRTLTNCYRGEVREVRMMLTREVNANAPAEEIIAITENFLVEIEKTQAAVRELIKGFLDPRIPEHLREGLHNADEAISIKTEKMLLRLYHLFEGREEFACLQKKILPMVEKQATYRKLVGYPTVVSPDSPKSSELFLYRDGMLKRWAQSAMYMNINPSHTARRIAQLIAGFAAGLAMAFAVAAALFAGRIFDQNSMPWAIILIIAYIIKDRIKEVVRMILISRLPGWVSDISVQLVDPAADNRVGKTGSWVRFCKPEDMDEIVIRCRNVDAQQFRRLLPPENIIHYHRRIKLNAGEFLNRHSRIHSITEILRLKLNSWLIEMDDPAEDIHLVQDGVIGRLTANRVYHVNIILRLSARGLSNHTYKRYRVVLNRNGIERIEEVRFETC